MIELSISSGVAVLELNRPEKRNALNDEMRRQLGQALERIASDQAVRALVITGNGPAFCAGGDIAAMQDRLATPAGDVAFKGWSRQQHTHHMQELLHLLPIPTIAAVNGPANGLGADIALACDFIVASEAATFAWSYINRALIPDGGALYFLPRRVGLSRAKELVFTGRRLTASEALEIGVADRVTSANSLLDEATAWAAELSNGSRAALALGKGILDQSLELSLAEVFARGSSAQAICYTTSDHRAAVESFMDSSRTKA